MAHVSAFGRHEKCGFNVIIEGGLKPGAVFRLTNARGMTIDISTDSDEFLRLVAAIIADPRFKVGGRAPKPDPDLEAATNDLFNRLTGRD